MSNEKKENPLEVLPINKLLVKFSVPSIIAMLVTALYNIVDQFFIGQSVGSLGNAATSISFPLSITCIAIALLFGIGGASAFNLSMGAGDRKTAAYYIGNAAAMLFLCGLVLCIISEIFLKPMLLFFGSSKSVLPYAMTYTRITAIGFPMVILTAGGGHLIRADGSPNMSMMCNLIGAVINTVLDAIFVFGMNMGMAGAALATIIGQFVSAVVVIVYMFNYKTVKLQKKHLVIRSKYIGRVAALGGSPCSNQVAMMVVQIILNKSLKHYGSLSVYGEDIPVACVGIITKVNQMFFSFVIGLSQGLQPIASYNYGAGKFDRVKSAYKKSILCGFTMCIIAFAMFQIFPRQIISIFGKGDETYYRFAINYFRIFLFCTCVNCLQPITSTFLTAIGKPKGGMFLSLTRQIIFLLPLIVILPLIMGIDGIMYAGPIADGLAAVVAVIMIKREFSEENYRK